MQLQNITKTDARNKTLPKKKTKTKTNVKANDQIHISTTIYIYNISQKYMCVSNTSNTQYYQK